MGRKLRVGVLLGGRSVEHSVSLLSARYVLEGLRGSKYEVVPIGISPEGRWMRLRELPAADVKFLTGDDGPNNPVDTGPTAHDLIGLTTPPRIGSGGEGRVDVVFPVLHGRYGEDGTVQGLLEMANIPYVGSGVLASALGMDKAMMKVMFEKEGIPVTDYLVVRDSQFRKTDGGLQRRVREKFGFPCFVKPANSGSSVGVTRVENEVDLPAALEEAFRFDRKALVEEAVAGREIECSVLGNHEPIASVPGEVVPHRGFYDYRAKYLEEGSRLLIPAPLEEETTDRVRDLAVRAFLALECSGMARVDFFLEKETGRILVNELNTIPGFTAISMYPRLWEATGIGREKLLDRLIELALERHREKNAKQTRYLPDGSANGK